MEKKLKDLNINFVEILNEMDLNNDMERTEVSILYKALSDLHGKYEKLETTPN